MTAEQLIITYGYLAVFIGTFLEGETILILGGFAAHQGYLDLAGVMAAAFAGSLLGDQLYFHLGRRNSRLLLRKRPEWKQRMERFRRLLDRHTTVIILAFRFLYGLRTVGPIAIGTSSVSFRRFLVLNAIGAAVWAVAIAAAGYAFGGAVEVIISDIKRYEHIVAGAVAVAAIVLFIVRAIIRRRRK